MNGDLLLVLEHLEREKGIDREVLIKAVEAALLSAARKRFGSSSDINVSIDQDTGQVRVFSGKRVVESVQNSDEEISVSEAQKVNPQAAKEGTIPVEITPADFGRIAAQTAKQVVIQKIREAEREIIYREYEKRIGDIANGTVQRFEQRNVVIDLGKTEALIPYEERMAREDYRPGDRLRAYIVSVRRTDGGLQIILSRTHPGLVKKLFELEVPEISEGVVEIKGVARETGERAKIAVYTKLDDVDPIGACVGMRGVRVKNIVRELRGEKIDIVPWSENPVVFITNALSPAKVTEIKINEAERVAEVTVPDDQLSLAIGKKGQNVRLAAKLTGCHIDIKSESERKRESVVRVATFTQLPGVGEKMANVLLSAGYSSLSQLANAGPAELASIPGIGKKTAAKIIKAASEKISENKQGADTNAGDNGARQSI